MALSDEESVLLQEEYPDLDGALVASLALDATCIKEARDQCSILYLEMLVDRQDFGDENILADEMRGDFYIDGYLGDAGYESEDSSSAFTLDEEPLLLMDRKSPMEKLEFLVSSFPGLSKATLIQLLNDNAHNLSKTIDDALNTVTGEQLLQQERQPPRWLRADWSSVHQSEGPKKLNRRARRAAKDRIAESKLDLKIRFIADLLGIFPDKVKNIYKGSNTKTPASALVALMVDSSRETTMKPGQHAWITPSEVASNAKQKAISELMNSLPALPHNLVTLALECTQYNVEKATELALILLEDAASHKEDLSLIGGLGSSKNEFIVVERPHKRSWSYTPDSKLPSSPSGSMASNRDRTAELKRQLALKYEARYEAQKQAHELWRRKSTKNLNSSASAYHSQISSQYSEEIKVLKLEYARAKVDESATDLSIDLHGIGIFEANEIAHEYVNRWWKVKSLQKPIPSFTIVTGRGIHSVGGQAKLLPYISQTLAAEKWKVEVFVGYLLVRGKEV
ncbi:uncharacterized protein V1516DRAFT_671762 [Lipomyces oligophaga]|uniref:uncharacterized protein n=1 Tax=Lipomyces oligophaga TaxID=45792 RepID=UPI0034CE903C